MQLETGIAIFGGICGLIGMGISLICVACVVGFTRSTHTVQYVPLETPNLVDADLPVKTQLDEEEELLKNVGRKPKEPVNLADSAVESVTQTDFLT